MKGLLTFFLILSFIDNATSDNRSLHYFCDAQINKQFLHFDFSNDVKKVEIVRFLRNTLLFK
jgi:hypothetical protein